MGESCSARVLQCSLLNTMQNLEPATQTHAQGEGIHKEVFIKKYSCIPTDDPTFSVNEVSEEA